MVAFLAGSVLAAVVALPTSLAAPAESPAPATLGADAASPDIVPGEIAIDLRDDVTSADEADLSARYGVVMRPNSAWSEAHDKLEVADVDPQGEDALIEELSRDPRVEHVEAMSLYRASRFPDDPLYASKQWHLQRVGAERAWAYTCGRGVTVAVVDTGIACFDRGPFSRGTDLAGTRCEGGWNFVDDSPNAADDQGHGTHVAGTIAQTTNNAMGAAGLAFCATLMPVKVLNRQGFGSVTNVAEGIRRAAAEGAQIINLSLGGPIRSRILEDAVKHAISAGVVVVAAAGNSGGRVGWPAAYPGVVAVSATDDRDTIAWFSSRGPEVTIAAPGVGVTQQTVCNGGRDKCEVFGTFNGTSMASPHVAGAAAMVEALGVTSASAVRDALVSTARPRDDSRAYGAGIVDAGAAVAKVFWGHVLLRWVALCALGWLVARRIRRGRGSVATGIVPAVGALVTSVGLAPFVPLLGPAAGAGRSGPLLELAMRPMGEWDLVLVGAGSHAWFLVAGALPVFALTGAAFGVRRLRPFIGAFALGTAAFLSQVAWSADVAFPGGAAACRVWCAMSALFCLWVARVGLEIRRTPPAPGGDRADA
ncbi:MAG TPA: S8 family serine peptidase [Polyangiaceae bacterium]|nr:S8 family serine peptidase [Polyangiaceae bacterium]